MNLRHLKTVFQLTIFIIIFYTNLSQASITNTNPGKGLIRIFGDSLAAGRGTKDKTVQPLGCLQQLDSTNVISDAVSGFRSNQVLLAWKASTKLNKNVKLIFISSGGNDVRSDEKKPGSYPKEKTFTELNTLFDEALKTGAVVAYLGLNPPVVFAERLPMISEIAQKKGIIVIDGMRNFWGDQNFMNDKLHPNTAGYTIMCERMLKAIKPYYP